MLDFLLALPRVLFSFVWGTLFPARPAPTPPAQAAPVPDPAGPDEDSRRDGHELSDASPLAAGIFVLSLFGFIFVTMGALGWMYTHLYNKAPAVPVPPDQATFQHAKIAKTSIAKDWRTIDSLAHDRLDHYGWTDHAAGIVHIPISRAVELVSKEGLPARHDVPPPDFPAPDQEKLPLMELEKNPNAEDFEPR